MTLWSIMLPRFERRFTRTYLDRSRKVEYRSLCFCRNPRQNEYGFISFLLFLSPSVSFHPPPFYTENFILYTYIKDTYIPEEQIIQFNLRRFD